MAIYCDKCGARHECSVCPVCHGLGKAATAMTDELRAKFEAWWQCLLQTPNAISYNSKMPAEGDYRGIALLAYQAAHASCDAEVEALKRDAERFDWMLFHGAKVCWGSDGEVCNVEWFDEAEEELARTGNYYDAREAIDDAMVKGKP